MFSTQQSETISEQIAKILNTQDPSNLSPSQVTTLKNFLEEPDCLLELKEYLQNLEPGLSKKMAAFDPGCGTTLFQKLCSDPKLFSAIKESEEENMEPVALALLALSLLCRTLLLSFSLGMGDSFFKGKDDQTTSPYETACFTLTSFGVGSLVFGGLAAARIRKLAQRQQKTLKDEVPELVRLATDAGLEYLMANPDGILPFKYEFFSTFTLPENIQTLLSKTPCLALSGQSLMGFVQQNKNKIDFEQFVRTRLTRQLELGLFGLYAQTMCYAKDPKTLTQIFKDVEANSGLKTALELNREASAWLQQARTQILNGLTEVLPRINFEQPISTRLTPQPGLDSDALHFQTTLGATNAATLAQISRNVKESADLQAAPQLYPKAFAWSQAHLQIAGQHVEKQGELLEDRPSIATTVFGSTNASPDEETPLLSP